MRTLAAALVLSAAAAGIALAASLLCDAAALQRAEKAWGLPANAATQAAVSATLRSLHGALPPGSFPSRAASAAMLIGRRLDGALRMLPLGAFLLLALLARACDRRLQLADAARLPSPTLAYLSKRLVCALWIACWGALFSPLPVPGWALYACFAISAMGTALYLQNLPERL